MTRQRSGMAVLALSALLGGCAAAESPERACQNRLAAAGAGSPDTADSFGHAAYAAMDRTGCTARQLAVLDRIVILTRDLPGLSAANNRIGAGQIGAGQISAVRDEAAHMAAFQRMNDAVIELDDLQQGIRADLATMEQPQ